MQQTDNIQDPNYDEYSHVFDDVKTMVQPSNKPGFIKDISKKSHSSENETLLNIQDQCVKEKDNLLRNPPKDKDRADIDKKILKTGIDDAAHEMEHPEETDETDENGSNPYELDGSEEFQNSLDSMDDEYADDLFGAAEPQSDSDQFEMDPFFDPLHPGAIDNAVDGINKINQEDDEQQEDIKPEDLNDIDAILNQ